MTAPLPRERTEITLDLRYGDAAMAGVRKGLLPTVMEEKWFAWFEEPILHLHRSWTGACIYQIRFAPDGDGWRAVSAMVNRDQEQYTETNDDADRRIIAELIAELMVNAVESAAVDG